MSDAPTNAAIKIGWAQVDITPTRPVLIAGQFHARLSEGVLDPITATAQALEGADDHAVLVSCDLVQIPNPLRDAVRKRVAASAPGLDPFKVILNATHTHTGPEVRGPEDAGIGALAGVGVELPAMPVQEYLDFAAEGMARAAAQAWQSRAPGAVAFGQGHAVVGRNRRWTDLSGVATMYGDTDTPAFSHIEGYEDHSVDLFATLDTRGGLTGLAVNVPCPSQVSEQLFVISADYWHETRQELRRRLGSDLAVLPLCSAAGDQSPHLLFEKRAAERMLELTGRTPREEIAHRIAEAAEATWNAVGRTAESAPVLRHHVETVELPRATLTEADARAAVQEADLLRSAYEEELRRLAANPALREDIHWCFRATYAYRRMRWCEGVARRFERQKDQPTLPIELHVIRVGDAVFATNPFEYYLDYGIRIKARSKAVQTFLVQLAGEGTYIPTPRSQAGGGYGSIPASNPVGPEGGQLLAEKTIAAIDRLYAPAAI